MTEQTHEEKMAIAGSAERQMRRWLLAKQIEEKLAVEHAPDEFAKRLGPYIAISRESGSGGGPIARLVGEKLGWEVLDNELLDFMAERYRLPRDMLEFVDETRANWIHETFGKWLDARVVDQEAYVNHLGKIVLLAAQHGKTVLVGRGAQFLLPRNRGLAVRIIAPEPYRIEQTMQRRALSRERAKQYVNETDRGRREFVRRYFHHDVTAAHLYDLVINSEKFGPKGTTTLIVEAFQNWSREQQS